MARDDGITSSGAAWLMFGRAASMSLAVGTDLLGLAASIPTSTFGGPEDPLQVWPLDPWNGTEDFTGQVAVGVALGRWHEGVHRGLPLPGSRSDNSDKVTLCIRNLWGPALIDEGFVRYWQSGPARATMLGSWSQPGFLLVAEEGFTATILRGIRLGPWTVKTPSSVEGFVVASAADGEVAWGLEVVRSESGQTTHFVMGQSECDDIDAAVRQRMTTEALSDFDRPEWLLSVNTV